MPMMPKRVKFRKSQRGKMKGNATRGNTVAFGEYGLQSIGTAWVSARVIEAGRAAVSQHPRHEGTTVSRHFPQKRVARRGDTRRARQRAERRPFGGGGQRRGFRGGLGRCR